MIRRVLGAKGSRIQVIGAVERMLKALGPLNPGILEPFEERCLGVFNPELVVAQRRSRLFLAGNAEPLNLGINVYIMIASLHKSIIVKEGEGTLWPRL